MTAIKHTLRTVTHRDVPAVGYSVIEDTGEVDLDNGKRIYFTAQRIYDRKAPKGLRISYEVALERLWGKTLRLVPEGEQTDLRAALIGILKDRIETDNAKDAWSASERVDWAAQDDLETIEIAGSNITGQVIDEELEGLTIEAYGKVSGTTKVLPITQRHLDAVSDYQAQSKRQVLQDLKDGNEVHARVIRFRLVETAGVVRASSYLSLLPIDVELTPDLVAHIARNSIAALGPDEVERRLRAGEAVPTHARSYWLLQHSVSEQEGEA